MIEHTGPISGIAAYEDRYVITAGYDNNVILWDQKTKKSICRTQHDHLVNQVAFSSDGQFAVSSSSDYSARVWQLPDMRLYSVLRGHDDDVEMSVFHPGGQLIATASRDHNVRVFNLEGACLATLAGHTADVISVEWNPDGTELISSSDDGTVKRWSLDSKALLKDIDLNGVETDTIAITRNGVIFAGNDEGKIVRVADDTTSIQAHDAGIKRVIIDPDKSLLVSLSYDRRMKIWDATDDRLTILATAELPDDVWPRSAAFAGNSKLVFATFGSTYRTFDYSAQTWLAEDVPPTGGANAVLASKTHGVVTVGDSGTVKASGRLLCDIGTLCNFLVETSGTILTGGQLGILYDAVTGKPILQHRSPLNCGVTFERSGREHVLIGCYTGEGLVLDMSGDVPRHIETIHLSENAIKGVAHSAGMLFSVSADAAAAWFDAETLTQRALLDGSHDKIANGCAGLDTGFFASVSRDLKLRIWDGQREATVLPTPHDHSIKCVAASADGRYIATGGYHGRIAVYDRQLGRWISDDRETSAGISALAFDRENHEFLGSSYDGRVYRVPVA